MLFIGFELFHRGTSKKTSLSLQFLVKDVKSKTVGAGMFHFGKQVTNLLLSCNLFLQVFTFDEVAKLSIAVGISDLMEFQKNLVNGLFQFQLALDSLVNGLFQFFKSVIFGIYKRQD